MKNPSSSRQQHIDFKELPMQEATFMLRRIATGILSELLDSSRPPGKPLPPAPRPNLLKYMLTPETRALSKSQTWKPRRGRPLRRVSKNMREQLSGSMKKMYRRTLAGKMKPRQWEIAANNRVAFAIGGTKGSGLPDPLWPVVAANAWTDPNFQLDMSLKINQWLRTMRVLAPYQPPEIRLSVNTFWVLICLADIQPARGKQWFSTRERARVRIAGHLQEEALVQAMTNQWAGFWDQWIFRMATHRWPDGFRNLDPRLCKALLSLPLLDIPNGSTLYSGKRKLRPLKFLKKKLFDKIDRIKRLKRPTKDFRKVVLLNLCHNQWEEEMPEFFAVVK